MTADAAGEMPEGVLLGEAPHADPRAKVTEAWREFAGALADQLASLAAGSYVDVTLDPTASGTGTAVYSVSLRVLADAVVEALAGGNTRPPAGVLVGPSAG